MRKMPLVLLVMLNMACNKNKDVVDETIILSQRNITKVEGAATGNKTEPVVLTVYWPYTSGCDVLENFEETKPGNIIYIKAMGYVAKGFCTQDAGIKTKLYRFTSSSPGIFELRFINKDNSYISHTIVIN